MDELIAKTRGIATNALRTTQPTLNHPHGARRTTNVAGTAFCQHRPFGWAVRDIDTTIKNFEDLGLGPWRRYILGEADGGHDFLRRDYEGGLDNRAKVALSKWGPTRSSYLSQSTFLY